MKIPAGVDTGTRVQLTEQGEVGPGGGPPGDLFVEIHVASHETFTRHGNDLHCTVTVPMTAAALGTTLQVPTLEADLGGEDPDLERSFALEIKPGTQSGASQTMKARGVPGLRGVGRGDLIVTVLVDTPTRLDARQEELLRELAAIRGEESPDGHVRLAAEVGLRPAPRRVPPARMSRPDEPAGPPRALAGRRRRPAATVEVTGDEAHHAVAVRRLRAGEQVVLTDGAGTSAVGEVAGTGKRVFAVTVTVGRRRGARPSRRSPSCRRCPRATAASSRSRC